MQIWQTYISITRDLLTSVAAITAAIVAVLGLHVWKKQLKGKVEYELARRVLREAFNVRDAIRYVRNPFQMGGEIDRAVKEAGIDLDPRSSEFRAKSEAPFIKAVGMSKLEVELLEAEVSWGDEILNRVKRLRQCIATLNTKIWLHTYNLEHPPRTENESSQRENHLLGERGANKRLVCE